MNFIYDLEAVNLVKCQHSGNLNLISYKNDPWLSLLQHFTAVSNTKINSSQLAYAPRSEDYEE